MKAKDLKIGDAVKYRQGKSAWLDATVLRVDPRSETIDIENDAGRRFSRQASKLRKA